MAHSGSGFRFRATQTPSPGTCAFFGGGESGTDPAFGDGWDPLEEEKTAFSHGKDLVSFRNTPTSWGLAIPILDIWQGSEE
jgi:hypothetical protein